MATGADQNPKSPRTSIGAPGGAATSARPDQGHGDETQGSSWPRRRMRGVTPRFLVIYLPLLFLCGVSFFAITEIREYHVDRADLRDHVKRVTLSQSIILADPVRNGDAAGVATNIAPVVVDRNIVTARVTDSVGAVVSEFGPPIDDDLDPDLAFVEPITYGDASGVSQVGSIMLVASDSAIRARAHDRLSFAVILGTIVLVLTALVAVFAHYVTIIRPLHRLSDRMEIVSREQDFSIRAQSEGINELDRLIVGFNSMLAQIGRRDAALEQYRAELSALVAQRTEELSEARDRLQAIFDTAADAIMVCDGSGKILLSNPAFINLFLGFSVPAGDVMGADLMPEIDWENTVRHRPRYRRETLGRHADGGTFQMELTVGRFARDDTHAFVAVIRDTTERHRSEEALRAAKLEAEAANRAKSLFLSSMSHELRTPLNAILGFAQLMKLDPAIQADDNSLTGVNYILDNGGHLLDLINDVLDLSSIESGIKVEMGWVNLQPMIAGCLTTSKAQAKQYGVTMLDLTVGRDLPWVRADETRLRQILMNLISNAIKYNRKGGEVTIRCDDAGVDNFRLVVDDTGEGVPEELAGQLFLPFARLGKEALGIEGTGIGLTICQSLAKRMDLEVGYDSTRGVGSSFWIRFPRSAVARAA